MSEPVRYGPVGWPDETRTLGWDAMEWASRHLVQPDRPVAGQPWQFTEEQARFVCWWYAIDDRGQFPKNYAVLRRMKGWGKDPLAAVMAAIEFIGPCRFGGWKSDGTPIVMPQQSAWVQIAAVSKEQTRNTMVLFPSLFSRQTVTDYSIDIGREIIYADYGRAQIQAVTSSPKTLEGARATFTVMGEPQHWLANNEGIEMSKAIRRNSAKIGGRVLAITNAHRIGEGSVAEQDWEEYLAQGPNGNILYDSVEAPVDTDIDDDESLRFGLMAAAGDSYWVPIDRLMVDARDNRDTESYRRRYFLNQIMTDRSTWISQEEWRASERIEEVRDDWVALGFDGSRTRDATALVATNIRTGFQWVLGAWTRPAGVERWEVPRHQVDECVDEAFSTYRIYRMYADPYWWDEAISVWAGRYGEDRVIEFRTNSQYQKLGLAVKSYENAVRMGELGHERNALFAEHISNCVKLPVGAKDEDREPLYVISKENRNSLHKIDVAMAAVLSWAARNDAIADGVLEEVEIGGFFA